MYPASGTSSKFKFDGTTELVRDPRAYTSLNALLPRSDLTLSRAVNMNFGLIRPESSS